MGEGSCPQAEPHSSPKLTIRAPVQAVFRGLIGEGWTRLLPENTLAPNNKPAHGSEVMKFGIFYELQVPRQSEAGDDQALPGRADCSWRPRTGR